jgi:transposase
VETIVERAAGLDVHQAQVTASIVVTDKGNRVRQETRQFRTHTGGLLELSDWLAAEGITHVGMESTGIYWQPVYFILEASFRLIVGNAHHIKNVPGRKTDVKDSQWIAQLVRHGLIQSSFVPPPTIREMREVTRYRRKLVDGRSAERNRVLKLLERANIKIASVASNVFGVSGMLMLRDLADGKASPEAMAAHAKRALKKKIPELVQALTGRMEESHRILLRMQLQHLEQYDRNIAELEQYLEAKAEPYREKIDRLTQIPGVDRVIASTVIAELGDDMSVFKDAKHAAAWAGLAPGNSESAGKKRNAKTRSGNPALRTALVSAALAAARTKDSYFQAQYRRLVRKGKLKALVAIAHSILITAFHMLRDGTDYRDLGPDHFDHIRKASRVHRLKRQLEALGYEVRPKSAA